MQLFTAQIHLTVSLYIIIGPFRFVDSYGADKLVGKIEKFRETYGDHFVAAPLLLDFAKDPTKKFHPN